ncbi:MAG: hypothetical protein FWG30_05835 [Eubacteriaceae bacterium]|jgi:hypothetical protein|nr:hypothetical protein [Eubacteriaceae bacterium]
MKIGKRLAYFDQAISICYTIDGLSILIREVGEANLDAVHSGIEMIVTIMPGPCKLITKVTATDDGDGGIAIEIDTQCNYYKEMSGEINTVDAYEEIFTSLGENSVTETCRKYCKHATCLVPTGILKAIEAEAKLALPTDASIVFEQGS